MGSVKKIQLSMVASCVMLVLAGSSRAQYIPLPNNSTNPNGFSGRLISYPLTPTPIPSLPYFPGSQIGMFAHGVSNAPNGVGVRNPGIAASNPFAPFYGNPLAGPAGSFGAPLYEVSTSAVAATGTGATVQPTITQTTGIPARAIDAAITDMTVTPAVTMNLNILRGSAPATARLSAPAGFAAVQPRADLQQIIDRSSALAAPDVVQVVSDGSAVVLRGVVVSEYDRRLAEALLRLSPGVGQIRNELLVKAVEVKPATP